MNAAVKEVISTGLASSGGHWYQADGAPAYEIQAKAGHMRAVTLRDARKLNLFPSVTGILQCAAKPQLERWKIEQAMMACITLPRVEWENETDFMYRALEDSQQQALVARTAGVALHTQIETSFEAYDRVDFDYRDFVAPVRQWLDARFGGIKWSAEKSFASLLGYGGKVDLHSVEAGGVVVDFKTKDFGVEEVIASRIKGYDEQGIQLAAYAMGLGLGENANRLNLFISTREPGLIVPVEWKPETFARHWDMFQALLAYWQADKGYAPC
jgi:hypothetical protein